MADINIEKKRRSPLPLILGVLALALLAFLLMTTCADDEPEAVEGTVVDTTTSMTPAPTSAAPLPAAPMDGAAGAAGAAAGAGWIGGVLAGTSAGGTASGEGTVPATPSDRGFWIEENGQRVFAVLAEPMEQLKDVDPGQRVRISNAQVIAGTDQGRIPADVDAEAKQTAGGQPYFLLVPSSGVEIVAGGNTTVD